MWRFVLSCEYYPPTPEPPKFETLIPPRQRARTRSLPGIPFSLRHSICLRSSHGLVFSPSHFSPKAIVVLLPQGSSADLPVPWFVPDSGFWEASFSPLNHRVEGHRLTMAAACFSFRLFLSPRAPPRVWKCVRFNMEFSGREQVCAAIIWLA